MEKECNCKEDLNGLCYFCGKNMIETKKEFIKKAMICLKEIQQSRGKKMKIETMKDLKEVLSKVPDEVLDVFGIGFDDDANTGLVCNDGVELEEMTKNYKKHIENHPELSALGKYVNVILKKVEEGDNYSDGFIKIS